MYAFVYLVSTLMLIRLEAVIGCQFHDGTTVTVAVMEDCPTNTTKQVHSYGPIMSLDQLGVYPNKPINPD